MKGLDLRKLKKISSDDKTTVFKHENGHELKIAHAGLSSKMLSDLKSLPIHGGPQKMADGGEPNPQPNESPDNSDDKSSKTQSPVTINIGGQQQPQQTAVAQSPVQSSPPNPIKNGTPPQTKDQEESPEVPDAVEDQSQQDSQSSSIPSGGQMLSQPMPADAALAHLNDQTAKLRQDFNNGVIKPETYHDLFEKRDTLGKIGMLFGLLAGGMGSGLTGQQNAVLGMMDKEIDRDLEAQKQSRSNQFSALNLAETHYKNEVENYYTQQQAKSIEANIPLINANASIAKLNAAKTALELAAEQHAMIKAKLLPENTAGGQRARAAAGLLSNAITIQQAKRNQAVANQIEANGKQIQQQNLSVSNKGSGYILNPDAADIYRGMQYDPTKTAQQKSDIESQYNQAVQAEKALQQIDSIYPKVADTTTVAGSIANATEEGVAGVPVIGELGKLPGEAIRDLGGQKEKLNQTYRTQLKGYIGSALAGTNVTPSEISKMAEDYLPKEADSPEVKKEKQQGLKDKIITLLKTSALDSAGMTRKKP